jgi:hypothetical protein
LASRALRISRPQAQEQSSDYPEHIWNVFARLERTVMASNLEFFIQKHELPQAPIFPISYLLITWRCCLEVLEIDNTKSYWFYGLGMPKILKKISFLKKYIKIY